MGRSPARRLATVCATALAAAALAASASAANASAQPGFWVSPSAVPTGANTSCQTAGYSTVTAAVTAAEAYEALHHGTVPTIDICPGTYTEQLTIMHSLVLTRAPVPASLGPVTIQLPAVPADSTTNCQAGDAAQGVQAPQSVVEICSALPGGTNTSGVSVTIRDVTVEGNWPNSVCYDSLYDILVGGGASLSLTGSVVERAGAYPLNGCQGGIGVQVGFAPTSQVGHGYLSGDTVETYQKNGITVDGPGSSADIDKVVVSGIGPTAQIAQNGIQISFGATASLTNSTITGNNYTGTGDASSAGLLTFGGGGSACGLGAVSPLVEHARFVGNVLIGNDIGVALADYDPTCSKSAGTPTRDTVCYNSIQNSHGYPGGVPSPDANVSGFGSPVGYQAGVSDVGNQDLICDNNISGAGYAPRDATSSLPSPPPPAFVRPIDVVSGPAIDPGTYGNTFDGRPYYPS
jgi:hypothetical protein